MQNKRKSIIIGLAVFELEHPKYLTFIKRILFF